MIVLDRMLIGGISFVLDKIAAAVDAELNDEDRLREELLATQMRLELGEIDEAEFKGLEHTLLARLREIRERRRGLEPSDAPSSEQRVTGIEADVDLSHHGD